MTNILINDYNFDQKEFYEELSKWIPSGSKVVILPFSFEESFIKNAQDEMRYYGVHGTFYNRMVEPLKAYGIKEDRITVISYYGSKKEDVMNAIEDADIVYLPSGGSNKAMERMNKFGIVEQLRAFTGTVIGVGKGARIQLASYHITPSMEQDYFSYESGIGLVDKFDLEESYEYAYGQKMAIQRVLQEKSTTVYAITAKGVVVVEGEQVHLIGDVIKFEPVA